MRIHTSSPPSAHGPIARIIGIATDIPHFRIYESFALEVFAE